MKTELLAYLRSIDKRLDKLGEYAAQNAGDAAQIRENLHSIRNLMSAQVTVPEDLRTLMAELRAMRLELRHQMENADEQGTRIHHLEAKLGQR